MERFIMGQGTFSIKPVILFHEERDKVLCSGPHYLLRRPVIMKPWVPEFNFKEKILTTIPLWIKLPNLPLNCWNSVVLNKIGSSLGKPLHADECTTQVSRISFARILVKVDVTRQLPKVIKMQDTKGRVIEQKVWYEWKPIFCQKCPQMGYSCVEKLEEPIQLQKKNQGQVEENQQEQTTKDNDGTTQGQGEWQTIRHRTSSRRDYRNIQGERGGQGERNYIWTNGHVYNIIDKVVVNAEWVNKMETKHVIAMEPLFSDHSTLVLILEEQRDTRKRPFRFYNCIGQHPDFRERVKASWKI
ncbi:hypothetical protein H5410_031285 [Solanum commersonii]|uniref:DUF4283 domain-containing protein n=1 Tax=Solanum commersonii TaxID=4109 RepID=A0A9J5YGP6_SOLCO|nr:hypothetical protein H5410_031285 [Solanum commersonii]